jgi:RNA polymerase sigma factor (sigma-70 family)
MDQSLLRTELQNLHRQSFGWAMSCCRRHSALAEDVLQRVYLKVLEEKARYSGTGSFKTWLFAVIRTTAQDEARREILRRVRLVRYAEQVTRAPEEEELPAFDQDARVGRFAEVLGGLPNRQRQVLQLVFYHDMSLSEAAGVMGVSIGSVRTHYDRGKKAVRQRLQEKSTDGCGPRTRAVPSIVL